MRTHGKIKLFQSETLGASWAIEATPNVAIRLKRIFPRLHQKRTGMLWIRATDEVARDLRWMLQRWPMEIDDHSRAQLDVSADAHEAIEEVANTILQGVQYQLPKGALTPAREPRPYQLQAADLALATGRLLIADELGLGKTFTSLLLLRDPAARPALVVCPTHLPAQWRGELKESFPELHAHIIKRGEVYDPTALRTPEPAPDVWIINYAKLAKWADHLAGVNTVIFDEAQELRRPATQKYGAAGRIADAARYKVGLTATPVYNYGGEVHSIFDVIAPGELGSRGEFYIEWGLQYGSHLAVRDPKALGHHLLAEHLMIRRTRKQVGRELPEVQRILHTVEADEAQLEQLSGDAIELAELILDEGADRRRRFTAAGDLDWKMRRATGIAKARYVAAFVKMLLESGEKVLLFGWHRDVYDIWSMHLEEYKPRLFTGSESPTQKQASIDDFREGDCRVLMMSLRSGAGVDGLQESTHICVFGELDWSPGMHDQCIGRVHRDGQDEPVVAYFLAADRGSDPVIAETLNIKRMQGEPIRDPDKDLLEAADSSGDRTRRLAERILSQRPSGPRGSLDRPHVDEAVEAQRGVTDEDLEADEGQAA